MKWDFKMVVLIVEWSYFRGGLKAGFYCTQAFIHQSNKRVFITRLYLRLIQKEKLFAHVSQYHMPYNAYKTNSPISVRTCYYSEYGCLCIRQLGIVVTQNLDLRTD